jgi:hypothetical protein
MLVCHDISVLWFRYVCVQYGEREALYLTTLAVAELCSVDGR